MIMFTEAQLREFAKKCFLAGFEASAQGWNGEFGIRTDSDRKHLSDFADNEVRDIMEKR
ncbi:hypothetical protein BcepF1.021 [Burkholderia phage BcepF1]|uniref:Uncharacterized protein n=1 Tax=Burkholderia phage BcepF1 TaxID=2886897 RepID=A1YZS5_9CAUD|nr:hypothetical protein BcepF1.021 [Burkholderia phage BcepF1]ABL96752.1 hypothetical protein BcepF1.021 [Burkholderia phage BcepF1]